MPVKCSSQPFCRYCGRPTAKRTTTVYPYTDGDRLRVHPEPGERLRSKADCQKRTNQQVMSVAYHEERSNLNDELIDRYVTTFTIWDGESYEDDLFDTNRCAIRFARVAARQHNIAMPAYNRAVRQAQDRGRTK